MTGCLLAGAVVNVAVCWGLALWGPATGFTRWLHPYDGSARWLAPVPDDWPERPNRADSNGTATMSIHHRSYVLPGETSRAQVIMAYGVPWNAMAVEFRSEIPSPPAPPPLPTRERRPMLPTAGPDSTPTPMAPNLPPPPRTDVTVAGLTPPAWTHPQPLYGQLPLHPHWPGVLLNTLSYAIVIGLLIAVAQIAHRDSRRRRGRCLACGYDVRSGAAAVCPECGATA